MKIQRSHIMVFLAVSILIWSLILLIRGELWSIRQYYPFFIVVGAMSALLFVFDKWLWSCRLFHPWLVDVPDLRGTWKVNLESDYVDPDTGQRVAPRIVFFCITQRLSAVQIYMYSQESESTLLAENIKPSNKGSGYQVVGVYSNKPGTLRRGKYNDMHLGALVLETHGKDHFPNQMTGQYWTNRQTTGFLNSKLRQQKICTTYEAAEKIFDS